MYDCDALVDVAVWENELSCSIRCSMRCSSVRPCAYSACLILVAAAVSCESPVKLLSSLLPVPPLAPSDDACAAKILRSRPISRQSGQVTEVAVMSVTLSIRDEPVPAFIEGSQASDCCESSRDS